MNIVQVMPRFVLAGAEIMCEHLTYELTKLGHKVTVISMFDYPSPITERLEKSGIKIVFLGKRLGLDASMISKIKKVLKETRADVVHTHLYCAQYAVPAAILAGVKTRVHTVHNIAKKENGKMARKLNGFFFKHCHLVPVALSESVSASIVEEYGVEKNRIPVIYNGIDLTRCLPKDSYSVSGSFKILHIGRFSEQKNHIGLLEAFKLFYEKHSNSELWLVGDGETRPETECFVKENGLVDSVKFLGLQDNVYTFLHDADVFTLPSNYEGVPMTLIEAMGTGLPIVATAVGGIPDMLTDGKNAFVVENNVEKIASAFEEYLASEETRRLHGLRAKERAIDFSVQTTAKEYTRIYYENDFKS